MLTETRPNASRPRRSRHSSRDNWRRLSSSMMHAAWAPERHIARGEGPVQETPAAGLDRGRGARRALARKDLCLYTDRAGSRTLSRYKVARKAEVDVRIAGREIRSLLMSPPVMVEPHWTMKGVALALAERPIGVVVVRGASLPWAMGSRPAGVISERDIVRAIADGVEVDVTRAEDVMTCDLVCAAPDEPVLAVAARMVQNQIRHLVVMENGAVIGVISERDVLRALIEERRTGT